MSDSGGLALLGVALWLGTKALDSDSPSMAAGFGLVAALAVGWRPQYSVAVVPLLLATVVLLRGWRARIAALQAFTVGCLAWLIPLIAECGSVALFWKMMSGQAAYFATHDADISRNGISVGQLLFRFFAHPWGRKWLSFPILAMAALGLVLAVRRRDRRFVPIAVMAVVYLLFALVMMDPADGVRYALPSLPFVTLLVMVALDWLRVRSRDWLLDWGVILLYGVGAFAYTAPVLEARASSPSPPVQAIEYIRRTVPRNAVILHDLDLRPHAELLLRDFTVARIDAGLLSFGDRLDLPLIELIDGDASREGGIVFRWWPASDAYAKLTRRHYRVVSVITIPPVQRYAAISGIWPPERARTESWRWVSDRGVIAVPGIGAKAVKLSFVLPPEYPFATNRITLQSESATATVDARRGEPTEVTIAIPPTGGQLRIAAERSVIPASLPGGVSRDDRKLAVMLTHFEQVR
jgi:hypothetical protein